MANSNRSLDAQVRAQYMELVEKFLVENGEEVLHAGSNELALPCVDADGNGKFIVLTFKVPTGSRDGDAYDGYAMAEAFKMKEAEKAEKAKVAAAKKAAKIERDKKARGEESGVIRFFFYPQLAHANRPGATPPAEKIF